MPWYLKDLDDLHIVGWAFASGSLAGLAYLCLFQRRRPTYRLIFGSFVGSGLVGISSAVALQILVPNYPGLWLPASIMLGLMGTHGIQVAVKIFLRISMAGISGLAKELGKEDEKDAQSD